MNSENDKYKTIECKICGDMVEKVLSHVASLVCWRCVEEDSEPPENLTNKKTSGRPPGWHFKKLYVSKDGNVYHKGILQPKLKGTLPSTLIKQQKKRMKKKERDVKKQEILLEINDNRKKLKGGSKITKKEQSRLLSKARKLNNEIHKLS